MMETVESELCFPHLLNSSCRKPQTSTSNVYLIYVVLSLISAVTTVLNLLVIISIAHFRQLHSSTNLILVSLAVSDFLIGLVVIPVGITNGLVWRTCWFFGDIVCALYHLLPLALTTGSVGTVVLISVDRYLAICDPLLYQTRMNEKVVSISISLCWIYAIACTVFISFDHLINPGKYKSCHGECMIHFSKEANFIFVFVIPVIIIIVLYIRVFVVAMSQARAMRSHVTALTCKKKNSKKSEIKAARNLGIVVLVYLMCYCPYYCVAYSRINILFLGAPIEMFMLFLILFNSCLNPVIYALLYPWFRKAIKLIVTLQILRHGSCDFTIL